MVRNCASICVRFPSLHDALSLQRFDTPRAQSLSAKDLSVEIELGATVSTQMLLSILTWVRMRDVAQLGIRNYR
jgi:hypothetical protein